MNMSKSQPELDAQLAVKSRPDRPTMKDCFRKRMYLLGGKVLLAIVSLDGLIFLQLADRLRDWLDIPWPAQLAVYVLVGFLAYAVITLPLAFFSDYVLPRRHGISGHTLAQWGINSLKRLFVFSLLGLGLAEVLFYWIHATPGFWWPLVAGSFVLVGISLELIWPSSPTRKRQPGALVRGSARWTGAA